MIHYLELEPSEATEIFNTMAGLLAPRKLYRCHGVHLCGERALLPADSVSSSQSHIQPLWCFPLCGEQKGPDCRWKDGPASIDGDSKLTMHSTKCCFDFITIFCVLLRLTSFLFFRRDWLSSMSIMRISGIVPPPRKRMVNNTIIMVVVPISWRFSMGSKPKWRLKA